MSYGPTREVHGRTMTELCALVVDLTADVDREREKLAQAQEVIDKQDKAIDALIAVLEGEGDATSGG